MGELLGAPLGVGKPCLFEELGDAGTGLGVRHDIVRGQGLFDLRADFQHGIEIGHGVLGDQADAGASQVHPFLRTQVRDVLTGEFDGAPGDLTGARQKTDDCCGSRGLAGAGLADDRDGLARIDREVCAANGGNDTGRGREGDLEVGDLQEGVLVLGVERGGVENRGGFGAITEDGAGDRLFEGVLVHGSLVLLSHLRAFGSRASRTASPIMMKLRTVRARASAG